jgi:hypothetical protein
MRGNLAERRAILTAQIAHQRSDLGEAYRNLEKPIHYVEYGLRGFGFLRQNTWVFLAVPAVFSVASSLLGLRKSKSTRPSLGQWQSREVKKQPRSLGGHVLRLGGFGWKIFQFYRRVRPFFL